MMRRDSDTGLGIGNHRGSKTGNRRSIRLKGYDYSQAGAYFVTICTQNQACLFGDVIDGEMVLNEYGKIVADEWIKTANIRNEMRRLPGMKLWQRNYYEHIVRNENELNHILRYIMDNPLKWALDRENPHHDTQVVREPPGQYGSESWMV